MKSVSVTNISTLSKQYVLIMLYIAWFSLFYTACINHIVTICFIQPAVYAFVHSVYWFFTAETQELWYVVIVNPCNIFTFSVTSFEFIFTIWKYYFVSCKNKCWVCIMFYSILWVIYNFANLYLEIWTPCNQFNQKSTCNNCLVATDRPYKLTLFQFGYT